MAQITAPAPLGAFITDPNATARDVRVGDYIVTHSRKNKAGSVDSIEWCGRRDRSRIHITVNGQLGCYYVDAPIKLVDHLATNVEAMIQSAALALALGNEEGAR